MAASFEERARDFIASHELVPPGSSVLVAVSGGPDSCALFLLFSALRQKLAIKRLAAIYVDHGLRPESPSETLFVADLAKQHGAEFYTGKLNMQHGPALQERARDLRYKLIDSIFKKEGFDLVAIAHQADDVAETLLINLTRGSGPLGLSGIPPKRGHFIRPLLAMRREEIEEYCRAKGVSPVRDSSNNHLDYLRNRFRLKLLPLWAEFAGRDVRPMLVRSGQIIAAEEDYMAKEAEAAFNRLAQNYNPLTLSQCDFQKLHLAMQRRVARLAIQKVLNHYYQPSFEQVAEFIKAATAKSALLWLADNMVLAVSSGRLILAERREIASKIAELFEEQKQQNTLKLPGPGSYNLPNAKLIIKEVTPEEIKSNPPSDANLIYVAAEEITWPLKIDLLPANLALPVLGHKKPVKVNKILSDAKIPPAERAQKLLLCDADENPLWIVGVRRSALALCRPETQKILAIYYYQELQAEKAEETKKAEEII